MKTEQESSFTLDEIEDVKVIIKANGKHYGIVPKNNKKEAKNIRIAMFTMLIDSHFVVNKSLEEI